MTRQVATIKMQQTIKFSRRARVLLWVFNFYVLTAFLEAQESTSLFSKTAQILEDQYYEPSRFVPAVFWQACTNRLQVMLPALELKQKENVLEVFYEGVSKGTVKISLASLKETFASCESLYKFLEGQLTDVNKITLLESPYEVLQSGLKTLDPHTKLLTPEQSESFLQRNQNQQFGVGFVLGQVDNKIIIQSVLEESPAEISGLREGDILLELNGILLPGPTLKDLQKQIDAAESSIQITIEKSTTHQMEKITLTKEALNSKAVDYFLINEEIGYFRIHRFSEGCVDQFMNGMRAMESGKGVSYFYENGKWKKENGAGSFLQLQSYIIDLRGNPGGLLQEAVRLCDYFLNNGNSLVTVKGFKGKTQVYNDSKGGNSKRPLLILIDGRSASASEIVSGCLQKYHRALVVGSASFGKGSVQQAEILPGLLGSFGQKVEPILKISVAEYFVANGEPIQNRGVTPNIELITAETTPGNIRLLPLEISREMNYQTKLNSQDTIKRLDIVQYDQIVFADEHETASGKPDIAIGFCSRLLAGDGPFENEDWKNNEFYSRKKDLCKTIKAEETTKLSAILAKQGILWEKGGEYSSNLKAELEIVNLDQTLVAGATPTYKCKITLNNKSNIPSFGVKGYISFDSISVQKRYLYWGKINGQELREAYVDLPLKPEWFGGTYPFTIVISDENGDLLTARRKLVIKLPEKPRVALNYKVVKNENKPADSSVEKFSLYIKAQNEAELISLHNEFSIENLHKEATALLEIAPTQQSDIPLGKGETIEVIYSIKVQKNELFKNGLPIGFHFRDLTSRQHLQTTINLKNIKPEGAWSAPLKEYPIEFSTTPFLGLIVLDASSQLKMTLPGKGAIKSMYVVSNNQKIFYIKWELNLEKEKEWVAVEFPKTLNPVMASIFVEDQNGNIQENIVCIQNQLVEAPSKK